AGHENGGDGRGASTEQCLKIGHRGAGCGGDEGLADDRDALAGAGEVADAGEERGEVVHGRDVGRGEEVRLGAGGGVEGADRGEVGPGAEVGEVKDGGGEGSERGREGELGGGGEVELGVGVVAGAEAVE